MKTNLAYIDTAANMAVRNELEQPFIPAVVHDRAAEASFKVIAGFKIADEKPGREILDGARNERLGKLCKYREDRDEIAAVLAKLDISPLAVLPRTAWEQICTKSGLFRLAPNKYGQVEISRISFESTGAYAEKLIWGAGYSFVILMVAIGGATGYVLRDWLMGAAFAVFTGFIALFLVAGVLYSKAYSREKSLMAFFKNKFVYREIERLCRKPRDEVLRMFFPNGIARGHDHYSDPYVQLVLPPPPVEVVNVLNKCTELSLRVAAVADAISFSKPLEEVLWHGYERTVQEREEEARRRKREEEYARCPIIYVGNGTAIAILAQFGDFPIEKKVVDEAMGAAYLL